MPAIHIQAKKVTDTFSVVRMGRVWGVFDQNNLLVNRRRFHTRDEADSFMEQLVRKELPTYRDEKNVLMIGEKPIDGKEN